MSIASSSLASFPVTHLPLPRWAYVPGAVSEADHAMLERVKSFVPPRFVGYVPARHPALRYGIRLNDAGYFWESHEVLEAVWAAAPQGGRERILLRACIQIANANLKLRMARPHAATRLFGEALTELNELLMRRPGRVGSSFAESFPAGDLAGALRARLGRPALTESDWLVIEGLPSRR